MILPQSLSRTKKVHKKRGKYYSDKKKRIAFIVALVFKQYGFGKALSVLLLRQCDAQYQIDSDGSTQRYVYSEQ